MRTMLRKQLAIGLGGALLLLALIGAAATAIATSAGVRSATSAQQATITPAVQGATPAASPFTPAAFPYFHHARVPPGTMIDTSRDSGCPGLQPCGP